MYKTILVPVEFDHNPTTVRALEIGRHLLDEGGRLIALHVVQPVPTYVSQFIPEMQLIEVRNQVEEAFREELGDAEGVEMALIDGTPGAAIVDYARRQKVDCIVIASHRPGLSDILLGSTASRVVRHAECSVHVVR